jgi:hypothetical protein
MIEEGGRVASGVQWKVKANKPSQNKHPKAVKNQIRVRNRNRASEPPTEGRPSYGRVGPLLWFPFETKRFIYLKLLSLVFLGKNLLKSFNQKFPLVEINNITFLEFGDVDKYTGVSGGD